MPPVPSPATRPLRFPRPLALGALCGALALAPALEAQKGAYKKEIPAKLAKEATITEAAAAATALAKVPGGSIMFVELEKTHGKLVYTYDITVAGKKGMDVVEVDAKTGAVVSQKHEGELRERIESMKEGTRKKPPVKKSGD
ncbi:MAG: PepSY domain-containing protein [Gemmatimonadetes bacterium]|nr:PepSY domain-containing protein [Gemmatimonadota bacterium]